MNTWTFGKPKALRLEKNIGTTAQPRRFACKLSTHMKLWAWLKDGLEIKDTESFFTAQIQEVQNPDIRRSRWIATQAFWAPDASRSKKALAPHENLFIAIQQ